jgi:SRSO17 transposase
MDGASSGLGLAAIERCADAWQELHARIAHRFARCEARERAGRYLAGLLERVERKNGWHLTEAMGEAGPHGVQRLLNTATWDTDGIRDDLRNYVVDHLADEATGVLMVDETGFLKKGKKSCGVARQYSGTAGTTANCQVGVFLAYASVEGAAFIDRALYVPREWADDPARRAEAGVPEATCFATKIELAKGMLARAFAADVPARWVVADACSGRSHALRRWLEACGRPYALMIPKTPAVWYQGRRERAEQRGERLCPELALSPWACRELSAEGVAGMRRWLLVRCDAEDPDEHASFLAFGPAETEAAALIRVCTTRWQIEEGFAQAKGEVGLDQDEVRKREAWHRHATLCLLAHADVVALRWEARGPKGGADPAVIPLTVPEVRRLVAAMGEPAERRPFRLGWSRWRRAHQAVAARCHAAHPERQDARSPIRAAPPAAAAAAQRTAAEWHAIRSLIPAQQPARGRPRHDHRTVLAGILWVVRSGASWRAMPVACGTWETAYTRYRVWCATGLWHRILEALSEADC